jgi:hypothetical protein
MAGSRIARFGAATLAAAMILSGCSLTGGARQAPNPNNTATGRPPTELSRMDSAAVAIFNAAAPHNAGTAGASAQDMIGRNATAGSNAPNAPGSAATGTGNGVGGAVQPGAANTGGGTGMTGTGTGTSGSGTGKGPVPGPGTTGTGTTGSGTGTGTTGTGSGTTGTGTGTGTTGSGTTGTTGTGTTGTGTTATGTATGTTASPGTTSRFTPSTNVPTVDWTRIQGEYNTVTASWKAVRNGLASKGATADTLSAVDTQITALRTAIQAKSPMPTAFAANDLTAYTASLLGLYRPGTPVQIYEMEYMAREVELDTESGNGEGALDAARSIGGVWVSLRTTAMARNKAHAGAVDAEVGRLQKSTAAGATLELRSEAATLLRDLQTLTRDFLTATR